VLELEDVAHQSIVLVQVKAAALVGGDDAYVGRRGREWREEKKVRRG